MKKISTFFATLLVSVLLIGSTSFAQTVTWAGTNGTDWSNATNWVGLSAPTAANPVVIPATANLPVLTANSACASLTIDASASLDLKGFTFASTGAVTINGTLFASTGASSLSSGRINIAGTLNATNITTIQVSGDWTRTGTYTVGTTGVVQFNGTASQTINSATVFPGLTIANTATGGFVALASGANISVAGQLLLTSGQFRPGSTTITMGGSNASPIGGTAANFVAGTSKVILQASNTPQSILAGLGFNNLDLNQTGVTFQGTGGFTVNGILNIITGTLNISTTPTIVDIKGNFTNTGSFVSSGAGTVLASGTAAQVIAGVAYNTLSITNTVGVSLAGTASVTDLTITGSFSDAGNQLTGSGAGTLSMPSGSFTLGSASSATTFPTFLLAPQDLSGGTGTVEYASGVAQTIASTVTYNRLVISGAGVKTPAGNFTVSDFNNSSSTLNDGGRTITVTRHWGGTDNLVSGTGTVIFSGGVAKTTDAAAYTFNNLSVTGGTFTPAGALTVRGNYVNSGGTFVGGAFTHTIQGNWNDTGGAFTNTGTTISFAGTSVVTATRAFLNFAVTSGGTVSFLTAAGLTVQGTFSNAGVFLAGSNLITVTGNWSNTGTFTAGTSTVVFDGAASTFDGTTFNNLIIADASTATANFASTSWLTVKGGASLIFGAFAATGAGTFGVETLGNLSTAEANGFNATGVTTGSVQMTGGRIYTDGANYTYNGAAAQSSGTAFTGATINNLIINNAAGVTLNSTARTTVNGTLTLTSGAFGASTGVLGFATGGTATIVRTAGSLSFAPTGGSSVNVTYNAAANVTTGFELPIASTTGSIRNLTINNTTGNVTLAASALATVENVLTLTKGLLISNGGLTLGQTATTSGASTASYVQGILYYQTTTGAASTTRVFPIGVENDYRPVTILFDKGAGVATYSTQVFNVGAPTRTLPGDNSLGKVAENRYYQIRETTPILSVGLTSTPGITVTLQYGVNDAVSEANNLRLAFVGTSASSTAWVNSTATSGSAVPIGFISGGATTVGNFTLATAFGSNNVLSVELVSFTGTSKDENISLTWTTATEHDNYGFNIERTVTGKSEWAEVGFVKGSGTSNSPKTYSFQDKVSGAASFDYRIKQTDINGLSRYIGSVVTVTAPIPTEFALSQNYPNPFNPSTIIKYSIPQATFVTLRIYNMLGQEVATLVNGQTDIGFHSITWNGRTNAGSFASSGVYIYRIVAGDFVQVKKMNFLK